MAREEIKTQYSGWQNWINVENRGFSKIGQENSHWPRISLLNQHLSII
jgi:hypothetical protein